MVQNLLDMHSVFSVTDFVVYIKKIRKYKLHTYNNVYLCRAVREVNFYFYLLEFRGWGVA